jgi:mono/diheme cytochrome c family protein
MRHPNPNPRKPLALVAAFAAASILALPPGLGAQESGAAGKSDTAGVYTKAQADAGRTLYDLECALCHGPREFFGSVFQRRWLTPPVSGLFAHIINTMPQDLPGSLEPAQVAALVAYILELNGHPAGPNPLPTEIEKLAQIRVQPVTDPGR